MRVLELLCAAWALRGVYGWQDWTDPVERAAMLKDWHRMEARR